VADREPVGEQLGGVHHHLVLLGFAAPDVDLDHARHGPEARADVPFQDGPKGHRIVSAAAQREMIDVAQAGRERPHQRPAVCGGNPLHRPDQSLVHELPRPMNLNVVLENGGDGGQPVTGNGPQLAQAGEAAQGRFDRKAHELFDLDGAQRGCPREDLHLHGRQVRHDVDRQVGHGPGTRRDRQEHGDERKEAMPEREVEELRHATDPRPTGWSV
jgi:hypothetical protein